MSLALPAFVLLLLLLPGLLVAPAYLGRFGRSVAEPVAQSTFTWAWVAALALAPALHALWISGVRWLGLPEPDLNVVFTILAGESTGAVDAREIESAIVPFRRYIFAYFATICLAGALTGWILRLAVRRSRLDLISKTLRFSNRWHYLFSGEQVVIDMSDEFATLESQLSGWLKSKREILRQTKDMRSPWVTISATVPHAGTDYLYVGLLAAWHADAEGGLVGIRLAGTYRRKLQADRAPGVAAKTDIRKDPRFYPVAGSFVYVWARDIRTLNVTYHFFEQEKSVPASSSVDGPNEGSTT